MNSRSRSPWAGLSACDGAFRRHQPGVSPAGYAQPSGILDVLLSPSPRAYLPPISNTVIEFAGTVRVKSELMPVTLAVTGSILCGSVMLLVS